MIFTALTKTCQVVKMLPYYEQEMENIPKLLYKLYKVTF